MTARSHAPAFAALWLAACASTQAPPPTDPEECGFWLEAPREQRLELVATVHEETFAGVEADAPQLPANWGEVQGCVRSRYSEQVRMMEDGCRAGQDAVETFEQSGTLLYSECFSQSPR